MRIALTDEAVTRFEVLLELLQTWGRRINLTTRLESTEVVRHHFLDSLAGAPFLPSDRAARVIDIGAGAGFPSFPLKFALPLLHITMAESVRKKVAFCREVIRATGCDHIEAICARGEDLARLDEHRGSYDWAVSRALGSAADVLRLAVPLLRRGGEVLLYKGAPRQDELDALDRVCGEVGAAWHLRDVVIPNLEERRSLILLKLV